MCVCVLGEFILFLPFTGKPQKKQLNEIHINCVFQLVIGKLQKENQRKTVQSLLNQLQRCKLAIRLL